MRRVVNSTFISLDGVTEHLDKWHFAYHDESADRLAAEQLAACDAMLMGRATYDVYAASWPGRPGEYADRINAVHHYVASTTLERAGWADTTVIRGDLPGAVADLKRRPGRDVLMHGFGPVARTLLQHGLLDELHLWVHPVLAGVGGPGDLIFRGGVGAAFDLTGTRTLDSGVVVLSYAAAGASR